MKEPTRRATMVVPCYNEAERLDGCRFAQFVEAHPDLGFLFVDDGSTDDTGSMLEQLCARHPGSLSAMQLQRNSGKGEAVRQGMLAACNDQQRPARYVGFFDADLATPLEAIPELCAVLDERADIDMVFGSRVNLLGREVRRNLLRHYIGRVFATAAAAVLRLPIYDTQCGAKLFRVSDELQAVLAEPFISRWIFDVEMVARYISTRRGTDRRPVRESIYELPLMRWDDVKGSKLKLTDFFVVGMDLARIWSRLRTES